MQQETFTDKEYSSQKKKTKKEEFLEMMEEIISWAEWVRIIAPCYSQGKRGRPPMGIKKMLRMYLLQIWFNLSDPAAEDAIYDSCAMRKFMGINFMTESVPDETTLCKFCHLLDEHGLNKLLFEAVNRVLEEMGHIQKARDPEMPQTKKGSEWRFGMKRHVGVDTHSGLVYAISVTAANAHDITQAAHLIREDDEVVYGDSAYLGLQKRPEMADNSQLSRIDFCVNRRPSSLPHVSDWALDWERHH